MKKLVLFLIISALIATFGWFVYSQLEKGKEKRRAAWIQEQQQLPEEAERQQLAQQESPKPPQTQEELDPQAQREVPERQKAQKKLNQQLHGQQEADGRPTELAEFNRRQEAQREVENSRKAGQEAERQRQDALAPLPSKPYIVDWFNDYAGTSDFDFTKSEGETIDREIKDQFEGAAPQMIQIDRRGFSVQRPLAELTFADLAAIQAEVAFIGAIGKSDNLFTIKLRVYSKAGKYLSNVLYAETRDRAEIARQYRHLALNNFPFLGIVTHTSGKTLQITLQAGAYISEGMIANRNWRVAGSQRDFQFAQISFDKSGQLTGVLTSPHSGIGANTMIVSVAQKTQPQHANQLSVHLFDRDGNKLDNFKVYTNFIQGGEGEYAGTTTMGEIDLSSRIQGSQPLYVTVKTGKKTVGTFETSPDQGPVHIVRLNIKSSDYK